MESNILSLLMALPLVGAAMIAFLPRGNEQRMNNEIRYIALLTTLITFFASLYLWLAFDNTAEGYQFVEKHAWFPSYNISYHLGIDGISLFLVILSTFLMPICVMCSWETIQHRLKSYMICFLVMETLLIGVFSALDLLLFYVFFEAILIPMYLIIGIWGGKNRIYAAYKFFLYTLAGSVLFLAALVYLFMAFGTTDIPTLTEKAPALTLTIQQFLWVAMFASFAVKVPMWPVHTWLPDAHVQAPTAGSVILAGILLKLGGYGFIRFSLPMLPAASDYFAPLMYALSLIAVVYTSLVALVQEDMKKLIAYSSVAHMGFVTLGLFTFNQQGVEGAMIQMVSHGLISGALFLCVGVMYDRMHTREIAHYSGVVTIMPRFALLFMFFTMASVALPGTSGFVGEFLVLLGTFKQDTRLALFAASAMVLGATYALWLYRRVMFGEVNSQEVRALSDVTAREKTYLVVIAVCALWLGLYANSFLEPMHMSVQRTLAPYDASTGGGE